MEDNQNYNQLTKEIFDQVIINENQPSVIIFGAQWSGGSDIMDKIVFRVSKVINKEINFFKVDIEVQSEIANFFGVHRVPTLVMIKHGEIIEKIHGFIAANKLKMKIEHAFSLTNLY